MLSLVSFFNPFGQRCKTINYPFMFLNGFVFLRKFRNLGPNFIFGSLPRRLLVPQFLEFRRLTNFGFKVPKIPPDFYTLSSMEILIFAVFCQAF